MPKGAMLRHAEGVESMCSVTPRPLKRAVVCQEFLADGALCLVVACLCMLRWLRPGLRLGWSEDAGEWIRGAEVTCLWWQWARLHSVLVLLGIMPRLLLARARGR